MASVDPVYHFILIRDGKLVKVGGTCDPRSVAAFWIDMSDNSAGLAKKPAVREAMRVESLESGIRGNYPASFVG